MAQPGEGLSEYHAALQRLVSNTPINIDKGLKITLSNVALEAGKDPSSIKKTRPTFAKLIEDIKSYATIQREANSTPTKKAKESNAKAKQYKDEAKRYENMWKDSLSREVLLLHQIDELQTRLNKITNVVEFTRPLPSIK